MLSQKAIDTIESVHEATSNSFQVLSHPSVLELYPSIAWKAEIVKGDLFIRNVNNISFTVHQVDDMDLETNNIRVTLELPIKNYYLNHAIKAYNSEQLYDGFIAMIPLLFNGCEYCCGLDPIFTLVWNLDIPVLDVFEFLYKINETVVIDED